MHRVHLISECARSLVSTNGSKFCRCTLAPQHPPTINWHIVQMLAALDRLRSWRKSWSPLDSLPGDGEQRQEAWAVSGFVRLLVSHNELEPGAWWQMLQRRRTQQGCFSSRLLNLAHGSGRLNSQQNHLWIEFKCPGPWLL